MKGTENEVYDKIKEYREEIEPLMDRLVQICNLNRVPLFICCAPKNTITKTTYVSRALSPAQFCLSLHENYFSDFLNVVNGLSTTYYQAPGDKGGNEEYEELVRLMKEGEERLNKKKEGSEQSGTASKSSPDAATDESSSQTAVTEISVPPKKEKPVRIAKGAVKAVKAITGKDITGRTED